MPAEFFPKQRISVPTLILVFEVVHESPLFVEEKRLPVLPPDRRTPDDDSIKQWVTLEVFPMLFAIHCALAANV